jgi:hypothetical protein
MTHLRKAGRRSSVGKQPSSLRGISGHLLREDYVWLFKKLPREFAWELGTGGRVEVQDIGPFAIALQKFGLYWWNHYELSFQHCLAVLVCVTGWKELLSEAGKEENAAKAFCALAKADLESKIYDNAMRSDPQKMSLLLNFLTGVGYSLEAIGLYGLSINELLAKARTEDINALKNAISIDRTAIATPTAARVIGLAQLANDRHVIGALFKRSKPHERRSIHSDLRFYHRVLWESGAIETGVPNEVVEMIVKDLGGYADVSDSAKNIRQLFANFRKDATI